MFTQVRTESPVNERGDGQVSYLLLAPGQFESQHLGMTWVDADPGSQQPLHEHPESELTYVSATAPPFEMPTGELAYGPPPQAR
jgi:hypothetical protein